MLCAFLRFNMTCEISKPFLILPSILLSSSESGKHPLWLILARWSWTRSSKSKFSLLTDSGDRANNCPTRVVYLDIRAFALSSCVLFCPIWLTYLRACSSLKRKRKVSRSWREGKWRVASISRVWQNCGLEVLCVWRIYFQFKNLMWK